MMVSRHPKLRLLIIRNGWWRTRKSRSQADFAQAIGEDASVKKGWCQLMVRAWVLLAPLTPLRVAFIHSATAKGESDFAWARRVSLAG